jgi:transcription initiation factor TFIIF subunit beta
MARMPRNQLFDILFNLFKDTPRWGVKVLREKTQQPEAYLKDVLGEIAWLHRSGEYNGLWELKDNYKNDGVSRLWFLFHPSLLKELTIRRQGARAA